MGGDGHTDTQIWSNCSKCHGFGSIPTDSVTFKTSYYGEISTRGYCLNGHYSKSRTTRKEYRDKSDMLYILHYEVCDKCGVVENNNSDTSKFPKCRTCARKRCG